MHDACACFHGMHTPPKLHVHMLSRVHIERCGAELSINPLATRLVRMLDGCNYRDFVRFLAAFSSRTAAKDKAAFMFECYDVDGDGLLTADDLRNMLRYLVAGHMSDEQVDKVIGQCFKECGGIPGIDADTFAKFVDTASFEVAVPQRL